VTRSYPDPQTGSRYIASHLERSHPICLAWARRYRCRPNKRWAILVTSDRGGLSLPLGWTKATFTNWSDCLKAIRWLEKFDGTYEEYKAIMDIRT